ncbi:MFS transporter [uncultured Jatrophihabitans sp.]|uniref:MFS transporter n=1 Tax=uncultured Jatrophihabitans sp. TaxID=1610747 RepID=UPI0035CA6F34
MALRSHHLLAALAHPGFRRLFRVRLAGQVGDGVFQASLAGAVLFDPQRAGHAADVAAAFAVLLLPYSVIGPFAGVLIDRWWRRRVLAVGNLVRGVAVLGVAAELAAGVQGVAFYASGLVVISLSRFVLSTLSAALPRVVDEAELVTANALTSTAGTVAAALGGGAAIGIRTLLGTGDADYAAVAALAVIPYGLAALAALRFGLRDLGPSEDERRRRETPREVVRGLAAGARTVRSVPRVENGLAMIAVHRLLYGVWTVTTVLLYRNYFTSDGVFRAGLAGLSQIVIGVAIGGGLASFITPTGFRRFGPAVWPGVMLLASAVVEVVCGLAFSMPWLLLSALLLAFTSQCIKISVDTVIQHDVPDAFRGRVFALYDMLFNVALVLAATITALALPESGRSPVAVGALTAGWALAAVLYVSRSTRRVRALRTSV